MNKKGKNSIILLLILILVILAVIIGILYTNREKINIEEPRNNNGNSQTNYLEVPEDLDYDVPLGPIADEFDRVPDCSLTYLGLTPLNDLEKGAYKGYQGGLYPRGNNEIPEEHLNKALGAISEIKPLDKNGNPDPNGKIVLMSVGVSNTNYEFEVFKEKADADSNINDNLVVVNGAVPGADIIKWTYPEKGGYQNTWNTVYDSLEKEGVTDKQVQVVWMKIVYAGPQIIFDGFPDHAAALKGDMKKLITQEIEERFPNVKVVYVSSRIRAYAYESINPEPYAYETGFAVKWLIEDQINGETFNSPVLLWGPYLWTDGLGSDKKVGDIPGRSDGLEWECSDNRNTDGTHPAEGAEDKVSNMLMEFFKNDKTTKGWFLE